MLIWLVFSWRHSHCLHAMQLSWLLLDRKQQHVLTVRKRKGEQQHLWRNFLSGLHVSISCTEHWAICVRPVRTWQELDKRNLLHRLPGRHILGIFFHRNHCVYQLLRRHLLRPKWCIFLPAMHQWICYTFECIHFMHNRVRPGHLHRHPKDCLPDVS